MKFIALLVAGALSVGLATAQHDHHVRAKIGLQLYTVRDSCAKDFEWTVQQVAKIGFSGVEFAGYYGRSAEQVKKMLDDNHLECYGTHTQLADLSDANFDKTVAFNKAIGNHLIIVPWIPDENRNNRDALMKTAKQFTELAAKLKAQGIEFGYHDHAGDFQKVGGEYVWDTLFQNSSQDVRMQFDTGNALGGGVQAAPFLTKYGGRVVSVHVKDFSATKPDALLGEGNVSWKDIIPIWKGPHAPKYFIIEQESYPFPSLVCASKCFHSFEKMMGLH